MRLNELADELGVSTQEVIRKSKELRLELSGGSLGTLTPRQVETLRRAFSPPEPVDAPSETPERSDHIGLYGMPRSGKTALLGVLTHYLLEVRGDAKALATQLGGWQPDVPDGQIREEAQRVREALLRRKDVPPTTKEVYRSRAFSFYNRKEWYTYETHDTSGENLREWAIGGRVPEQVLANLIRDASRSAGHVFLIDPTQTGGSLERQDMLWCNVLDRLSREEGVTEYTRPVLFVITKADDPSVSEELAMPSREKRKEASRDPVVYQALVERQDRAARKYVRKNMPQIWGLMNPESSVRRVRHAHVIAVSATGLSPQELGQAERLEPWRIAEPFRWVLDRLRPWRMHPKVQKVFFFAKAMGILALTLLFAFLILVVYSARYLKDIEDRVRSAIYEENDYSLAADILKEAEGVPAFVRELPWMPGPTYEKQTLLEAMGAEVERYVNATPPDLAAAEATLQKMKQILGDETHEGCVAEVQKAERLVKEARVASLLSDLSRMQEKFNRCIQTSPPDLQAAEATLQEMKQALGSETDPACEAKVIEVKTALEKARKESHIAKVREQLNAASDALDKALAELNLAAAKREIDKIREQVERETDAGGQDILSKALKRYHDVKEEAISKISLLAEKVRKSAMTGSIAGLEEALEEFMALAGRPGFADEPRVKHITDGLVKDPMVQEPLLGYYEARFADIKNAALTPDRHVPPTGQAKDLLASVEGGGTRWIGQLVGRATELAKRIRVWMEEFQKDEPIFLQCLDELDGINSALDTAATNIDATAAKGAIATLGGLEQTLGNLCFAEVRQNLQEKITKARETANAIVQRRSEFEGHRKRGEEAKARGDLYIARDCLTEALNMLRDSSVQETLNGIVVKLTQYEGLVDSARTAAENLRDLKAALDRLKKAQSLWPEGGQAALLLANIQERTKSQIAEKLAAAKQEAEAAAYDKAIALAREAYRIVSGVAEMEPFDVLASMALQRQADFMDQQIDYAARMWDNDDLPAAIGAGRAAEASARAALLTLSQDGARAEEQTRFRDLAEKARRFVKGIISVPWMDVKPEEIRYVDANGSESRGKANYFCNKSGMRFVLVNPRGASPDSNAVGAPSGRFYISATEVTQAQYEKVMGVGKPDWKWTTVDHPAWGVTWVEATEFCRKLGETETEQWGQPVTYVLPSEAQWEYACRAGTSTPFYCGQAMRGDLARYAGDRRAIGQDNVLTMRVSQFAANRWGLFDMAGNVWEWCRDTFHAEGGGTIAPNQKVRRGGSYFSQAFQLESSFRERLGKLSARPDVGFRVVHIPGMPVG